MRTDYLELTEDQRRKVQELELTILLEVDRLCKRHGLHYAVAYGTLLGAIRHDGFIPWDDDIDIWMPRKDFNEFRAICAKELDPKFFYQTHATDPGYYFLYDKIRMNGTVFRELATGKQSIHQGVYIDVFPVDNVPDDEKARKRHVALARFFRWGIQVKTVDLAYRSGRKRLEAILCRLLLLPFPRSVFYWAAQKAMQKHDDHDHPTARMATLCCNAYSDREVFPREIFWDTTEHAFEGRMLCIPREFDLVLRQLYDDYMKLPPPEKQVTRHPVLEVSL